jgi:hypothetical protein
LLQCAVNAQQSRFGVGSTPDSPIGIDIVGRYLIQKVAGRESQNGNEQCEYAIFFHDITV